VPQSVVVKSETSSLVYPFSTSPYYVADDFFGDEVYYATAYFVDPNIICNQVGIGMAKFSRFDQDLHIFLLFFREEHRKTLISTDLELSSFCKRAALPIQQIS
jgi:hypothetical protein